MSSRFTTFIPMLLPVILSLAIVSSFAPLVVYCDESVVCRDVVVAIDEYLSYFVVRFAVFSVAVGSDVIVRYVVCFVVIGSSQSIRKSYE